jgi:hypothetical protein
VPRTPLFRVLQRSFRLARLSAETGRPAGEVVDEARELRAVRDVQEKAGLGEDLHRRPLGPSPSAGCGL